ncbi:MAG: hypothetical protein ACP5RH_17850 [Leptodesmis sp.]
MSHVEVAIAILKLPIAPELVQGGYNGLKIHNNRILSTSAPSL